MGLSYRHEFFHPNHSQLKKWLFLLLAVAIFYFVFFFLFPINLHADSVSTTNRATGQTTTSTGHPDGSHTITVTDRDNHVISTETVDRNGNVIPPPPPAPPAAPPEEPIAPPAGDTASSAPTPNPPVATQPSNGPGSSPAATTVAPPVETAPASSPEPFVGQTRVRENAMPLQAGETGTPTTPTSATGGTDVPPLVRQGYEKWLDRYDSDVEEKYDEEMDQYEQDMEDYEDAMDAYNEVKAQHEQEMEEARAAAHARGEDIIETPGPIPPKKPREPHPPRMITLEEYEKMVANYWTQLHRYEEDMRRYREQLEENKRQQEKDDEENKRREAQGDHERIIHIVTEPIEPRKPTPPVGFDEPNSISQAVAHPTMFEKADSLKQASLMNTPNASNMQFAMGHSPAVSENKQDNSSACPDDH